MSQRTPRPLGPVSLEAWAQKPGLVVTRAEVLALLVMNERKVQALVEQAVTRALAAARPPSDTSDGDAPPSTDPAAC